MNKYSVISVISCIFGIIFIGFYFVDGPDTDQFWLVPMGSLFLLSSLVAGLTRLIQHLLVSGLSKQHAISN